MQKEALEVLLIKGLRIPSPCSLIREVKDCKLTKILLRVYSLQMTRFRRPHHNKLTHQATQVFTRPKRSNLLTLFNLQVPLLPI